MYRILLADDEGIMLTSMKTMIENNFGLDCEIATAKTGRIVVELAKEFNPDIIFMDIRMPGMDGLLATKEIRSQNQKVIIIVVTAYDKFDYAKEAIGLGAFDFLTKPVKKQVFINVLTKAMQQLEKEKKDKIDNLRIKEKLETVVPIIENGFVNDMLFSECEQNDFSYYLELMDIKESYGFIILLQFGEELKNATLTNPVGTSLRIQKFYQDIRAVIKQYYNAIISSIISNKIILIIPTNKKNIDYEERLQLIELTRNMLKSLKEQVDAKYRAGIGRPKELYLLKESYAEALNALKDGKGHVAHVEDYPIGCSYVGDYPVEIEKQLFCAIERHDKELAYEQATAFFDWMVKAHRNQLDNIRLKVLEFVMRAEHTAFLNGGMNYNFNYRENYLQNVMQMNQMDELKLWFLSKIKEVCHNIATKKEEQSLSLVNQAKLYIEHNFEKEVSLDEVSRIINISPYYFSKLFKEETGENFIDYLTDIRIQKAKELLKDQTISIKEVCMKSGYSDPNYFSRIFKKKENLTPSEYRERG